MLSSLPKIYKKLSVQHTLHLMSMIKHGQYTEDTR